MELTLAEKPGNSAEIIYRDADDDKKSERPGYLLARIKRDEHDDRYDEINDVTVCILDAAVIMIS